MRTYSCQACIRPNRWFATLPLVLPFATLQMFRQAAATSPLTLTQPPPAAAADPPTGAAPITLDRNGEARRAYRESRAAIMLLQQRWPAAFPEMPQQGETEPGLRQ